MKRKISITIEDDILKKIDAVIDNIIIRNRSQAIEYLAKNSLGENRSAVLLSGGAEEKLKIGPNEYRITAKINGNTLIERVIIKLRENGFKNIYLIARPKILTAVFDIIKDGTSLNVKVHYIEEKKSEGTAESLRHVKGKINTDFLCIYGHILFEKVNIERLWNEHIKNNSVATLMLTTSAKPAEKGTVVMEGNRILAFHQKMATDTYIVFSPIFVASPEILEQSGKSLELDIFPKLANLNQLNGHISSSKEEHIHTKKDISKLGKIY